MTLTSRQAPNLPAVATPTASDQLDVELRRAHAIAQATDVLPRAYRGKPGAILLAQEWAATRGLTLLEVLQGVAFVEGRPVVDAAFQRALAQRAGYRVQVLGVTTEAATVAVAHGATELGRVTYTLDDARLAGLAGKNNWKQHPKAMLVAAATRTALRWHAPEVLLGLADPDETSDPVDVLTAAPAEPTAASEPDPAPETPDPVAAPEEPAQDDIVDAELVEEQPESVGPICREPVHDGQAVCGQLLDNVQADGAGICPDHGPVGPLHASEAPETTLTKDELRATLKAANVRQSDAIRHAQHLAGPDVEVHNLDGIIAAGLIPNLLAWLDAGAPTDEPEDEA